MEPGRVCKEIDDSIVFFSSEVGVLASWKLVPDDLTAHLIVASSAKDFRIGGRFGHWGNIATINRSAGRDDATIAIAASSFATAGRFAATSVTATVTLGLFVKLDLDACAAEVIQEVEDGGAARLAAGFATASVIAAASRFAAFFFAASGRCTSFFAASSRFAAATTALLAFEQTLQASEQVALGLAARIAAGRFATFFFATGGWFATFRFFATGGFATATLLTK